MQLQDGRKVQMDRSDKMIRLTLCIPMYMYLMINIRNVMQQWEKVCGRDKGLVFLMLDMNRTRFQVYRNCISKVCKIWCQGQMQPEDRCKLARGFFLKMYDRRAKCFHLMVAANC